MDGGVEEKYLALQHTWTVMGSHKPTLFFQNKESRLKSIRSVKQFLLKGCIQLSVHDNENYRNALERPHPKYVIIPATFLYKFSSFHGRGCSDSGLLYWR
jgi:hypothetical protein